MNATYPCRADHVAARRIGDELMIMSAHDSSLFSLNESAAMLWDAADGRTSLADIVAGSICASFEVDMDTALRDMHVLAMALAERGILQLEAQPHAHAPDSGA